MFVNSALIFRSVWRVKLWNNSILEYISLIWTRLKVFRVASRLLGRRTNPDWSDMLKVVCGEAYTLMDKILIRLLFQVVVYHVWRERNLRRHQQGFKGTDQLICMVSKVVKNRISSLGHKGHHRLEGLMRRWFEVFG